MLRIENGLLYTPDGATIKIKEISSLQIRRTVWGHFWLVVPFLLYIVGIICVVICSLPALQNSTSAAMTLMFEGAIAMFAAFAAAHAVAAWIRHMCNKLVCNVQGRRTWIGAGNLGLLEKWKEQIEIEMQKSSA